MNDLGRHKTHASYCEKLKLRVAAVALLFALAAGIQVPAFAQVLTQAPTVTHATGPVTLTKTQMDAVTAGWGVKNTFGLNSISRSNPMRPSVFGGDLRDLPTVVRWQPGAPIRVIPRGIPRPLNGSKR